MTAREPERTEMMASMRFDRRTLLKQAAVAGAALPALGATLASPRGAAAATELEFWTPANDPVGSEIINALTDEFNSTIGADNGIHVNARIKPVPDNGDYTQYTTAMTSSGSPDVIMTYTYDPVVSWAANGFIKPIDEYAEAVGVKEEDFFPIAWSMINFDGHIWGLLQEFDFNQLWTNTAIHSGDAPQTIDDLDTLAAEYTQFDDGGHLVQAGFIPWMRFTGREWNAQFGGRYYDTDAGKWTIDTPENVAFLEWFLKHVEILGGREKSDALESSIPRTYGDIFQYGKVAFALEGEYLPQELVKQGLDLEYTVSHAPTAPEIEYGTATTGGGNLFLLPTNAKNPAEAALFIQFMGSTEGALKWCVPNSNLPPTKEAAADTEFTEKLPWLKPWLDALAVDQMVAPSPSPQYPQFIQLMNNAIDEVTYKQKSPQDALTEVAQKIADEVGRFQQSHPDWQGE
jgi:ABC-type glycerol-3-phosphate transport system substrate-binding protein